MKIKSGFIHRFLVVAGSAHTSCANVATASARSLLSGQGLVATVVLVAGMLCAVDVMAFEDGQTVRISQGNYSVMTQNSSLDADAATEMWTDAHTNSQRWVLHASTSGTFMLTNAYSGYYLGAASSFSHGVGVSQIARANATSRGRWELVPVEGKEGQYVLYAGTTRRYALTSAETLADASKVTLAMVSKADEEKIAWTVEVCESQGDTFSTAMRDDMMDKWRAHYYHKASTGYVIGNGGWWGDAEMFEVVLDALETTGDQQYATMFENLYTNFISRKTNNWISGSGYNEFNDDISWMCIACVRAYLLTGVTKYLSTAKTNFDGMYRRAAKYDNGTLVWKQGNGGTNSCINGPAAVCACYLGIALGNESYFEKAKSIYAGERGLLYNINSQGVFNGQVYDSGDPEKGTVGNTWSSTYNQGTCLGAAVMLYEHFGTAQYRSDADAIMTWTAKNLANSHGIIKVCQTVNGDLTGFKGILMRYVRRYAASLGHPEYYDWLARNAYHAWNNRNSKGISMSAWLHKTTEDFYYSDGGNFNTDGVGAFTAVSAAFNAHLGVVDQHDAYQRIEAEQFNFVKNAPIHQAPTTEDDASGYAGTMRKDHYVGYRNVDFGSKYASHVIMRAKMLRLSAVLNVYIDGPSAKTGTLVASVNLADNSKLGTWATLEQTLTQPVTGKHDVYIVCSGASSIDLAMLNWFCFDARNTLYDDVIDNRGTLTTSMQDDGNTLPLLADADPATQFSGVSQQGTEAWVQYDSPAPVLLQGYSLLAGIKAGADPTGWTLMASNDGQQWTTLHQVDDTTFVARGQRMMYDVTATTEYSHFRLVMRGKELQTTYYLSEWQLMGRTVCTADITSDGGEIDASQAPLVDHLAQTAVTVPSTGVVYRAAGNYVLTHYTVTTASSDAPSSWIIEGSNNGTVWKEIDSRSDVIFPYSHTTASYSVSNAVAYIWYRLRPVGADAAQLTQWQMFGNLNVGRFYPDASSLVQVSGPDGASQQSLVDDNIQTVSTVSGDSLYWILESPFDIRPLAYSIVASANRELTPTAVTVRGLADDGTASVLSSRNVSLNARGSRYTSTMSSGKSFKRFQLLVTRTTGEDASSASLMGFELYGNVILAAGAEQMPTPSTVGASADGVSASEGAGSLNDQNRMTAYRTNFTDSLIIEYSYAEPVSIETYALTAGKDKENCDPTDWLLQGSVDGATWVTLDERHAEAFSHRYATQFYSVGQPASYAHYRLVVTGVNGGNQLQLAELQLLNVSVSTKVQHIAQAMQASIAVHDGCATVDAPQAATLLVYDMQGRMLASHRLQAGQSTVGLPQVHGVAVVVLRMQGGTLVRKVRM